MIRWGGCGLREGGLHTATRYTEAAYNEAIGAALDQAVTGCR